jgi:hypothetical protein
MTTRLYCRECGWHPAFRRKRVALRAAAHHRCTGIPTAATCPPWWSRLWTNLWTVRVASSATITDGRAIDRTNDGAPGETDGHRVQRAVIALHHAETTRRARQAVIELVRAGYQIGPPPYGYRILRIRVAGPNGRSKLRAVLVPDGKTGAAVTQIFRWRADDRLSFPVIAGRLNSDPRQYPAPLPNGRWTAKAVRRVVRNVKYAGRQVWARTVAGRPVPVRQWVTSAPRAHEALVDERTFQRAQHMRVTGGGDHGPSA